jgi:CYTH domain-containing protein
VGIEIERKFLVKDKSWKKEAKSVLYRQGYLSTVKERTVRVRIIDQNGSLTIKGITIKGKRSEFEYKIPIEDAQYLLDHLCEKPLLEKKRYFIRYEGFLWEVDEFLGQNSGLIVAEIELDNIKQAIPFPPWIEREVTDDEAYYNANLVRNPFSQWGK